LIPVSLILRFISSISSVLATNSNYDGYNFFRCLFTLDSIGYFDSPVGAKMLIRSCFPLTCIGGNGLKLILMRALEAEVAVVLSHRIGSPTLCAAPISLADRFTYRI
jgi:hypothetical protein